MMEADSKYIIGHGHKDLGCQDYTLHGILPSGEPYAIVCDGCSAAPFSDVGARVQALQAYQFLRDDRGFNRAVFSNLLLSKGEMIGLRPECFTATLLIAVKKGDQCHLKMFGDGCWFYKRKSGTFIFKTVEFKSGAPNYIYYSSNDALENEYVDMHPPSVISKDYIFWDSGSTTVSEETLDGFEDTAEFEAVLPVSELEFFGVVSDGLLSFYGGAIGTRPDPKEIIKEFTMFPGFGKGFVQRRVNKAIKKFEKKEIRNFDDIGMGVIHVGE